MTENIQEIKEEAKKAQLEDVQNSNYALPKLIITEEDKTKYAECLATGRCYQERFVQEENKIDVTFRDKTKREGDIISRQVDMLMLSGKILSALECNTFYNIACLYYQLEEINGVKQIRAYPKSQWDMKDFDFAQEIENSPISKGSSSYAYVLSCLLAQFNGKLLDLSRRVYDSNFSLPAKDS